MKYYLFIIFFSIFLFSCNRTVQAEIKEIQKSSPEDVIRQLNEDSTLSAKYIFPYEYIIETGYEADGVDGFFIVIQSKSEEYPPTGIAFFENISDRERSYNNIKNDYKLKFANLYALMCEGCNNSGYQSINISGENDNNNRIVLSIDWGPSINRQYDEHKFIFDKKSGKWLLYSISAQWLDGERYVDTEKYKIPLDTYDVEENGFDRNIFKAEYGPHSWHEISEKLKAVVADSLDEDQVRNPLLLCDIKEMISDINVKNVQAANDCAYYLEQLSEYEQAEMILEAVLKQFPNRMVAYLNMGDVSRKQEKSENARTAYRRYAEMMKERGLVHKIPTRVLEYRE